MPAPDSSLDLRPATDADQAFLDQLYRSTRDDLIGQGDNPAFYGLIAMQQQIQEQGYRTRYPDARHLLLWHEAQPAARLVIDQTAERLHIVDLTVLAEKRSQGLGSALLRWAQQQAASADIALELQVQRYNHGARRLYLILGFERYDGDDMADYLRWRA